jgi:hypothetical protein
MVKILSAYSGCTKHLQQFYWYLYDIKSKRFSAFRSSVYFDSFQSLVLKSTSKKKLSPACKVKWAEIHNPERSPLSKEKGRSFMCHVLQRQVHLSTSATFSYIFRFHFFRMEYSLHVLYDWRL